MPKTSIKNRILLPNKKYIKCVVVFLMFERIKVRRN